MRTGGLRRPGTRAGTAALLAAALLVAACSDDGGPTATTATPTTVAPVDGGTDAGDRYTPGAGATGYDVSHYDLELRWDPDASHLEGVATITLVPDQPLASFALDLEGLTVRDVEVDGDGAEWDRRGIDLVLTPAHPLPAGEEAEVVVAYGGRPGRSRANGALGDTGWIRSRDGVFATGQPVGTRTWTPVNEDLADKATWAFRVIVPHDLTVAANGELEGRQDQLRRTTWTYTADDPMTPELATVAIGNFRVDVGEGPHELEILNFLAPGVQPARFVRTGEMIRRLERWFGPYPFTTYGVIVPWSPLPYALETQTRSTLPTVDPDGYDTREVIQVHELAHQWFGDSVTPAGWGHIWLNEGFATYAEFLWQDATEPGFDIDRAMRALRTGQVQGPILDPAPAHLFGAPVYYRGALTLHALRRRIGDDAFFELLSRWTDEHEDGVVTTSDFVDLAEDVSGRHLGPFFHAWLEQRRLPPA